VLTPYRRSICGEGELEPWICRGRVGLKASYPGNSGWSDEAAVVLPPVLGAVRPPDQGRPAGLAPCPGQDFGRPPALVGAQHLGPAMPRFVPGAAHHHPSRDTPRHWLNTIVAAHKYNTITNSILTRNGQVGLVPTDSGTFKPEPCFSCGSWPGKGRGLGTKF
jgi:hypothetical protein